MTAYLSICLSVCLSVTSPPLSFISLNNSYRNNLVSISGFMTAPFDHLLSQRGCQPAHDSISIPINILHESPMGKIRDFVCVFVKYTIQSASLPCPAIKANIRAKAFMLSAACSSTHTLNRRIKLVH